MGNFLDPLVAVGFPSAILYFFSIVPLRRVYHAREWLETPCVILSSSVEEDRVDSAVYRILITYRYEAAGRSYSSSRYDFSTGATCGFRGKKAVVDRLAPGVRTVCYVNPTDPSDSVVQRGITWDMLFCGLFAAILLITFAFFA